MTSHHAEHDCSTLIVNASILGSSSLSLARVVICLLTPTLPRRRLVSPLSVQFDVVSCKVCFGGTLGSAVSERLSEKHVQRIFFFVLSSMSHPSPLSTTGARQLR